MATARQRSGIRGLSKLRRTLRRIEPESTKEVREAIEDGLEAIKQDAIALVPKDTGALARGIETRLSRDSLAGEVGIAPGRGKRRARLRDALFYGRFIEYGTKGNSEKGIPPQPARPFMGPAFDMNKKWIEGRLARGIDLALRRAASGGATDD